jgi:Transposase DNA-binding
MSGETTVWASDEFGEADLGDRRRAQRLILMAGVAALRPAGKVTEVFSESAEREGAFRFLENDDVDEAEIRRSAHRAGARRCGADAFAYVPVDQTSLTITDVQKSKRLGMVGTRMYASEGLQVMTAVAVTPDGTPQGLVGQSYWTRERVGRRKKDTRHKRKVEDKETQHWLDVIEQGRSAFADVAPTTRPWFQLDRGGDAWPVLQLTADADFWITVRASWDRRVNRQDEAPQQYLWQTVERSKPLGRYVQDVPDGQHRTARVATVEIRAQRVTLDLWAKPSTQHMQTEIWAVLAREVDTTPAGEDPIEWMLLTNHPAASFEDARRVVFGYSQRWRIEEFHRAWKSGACRVEEAQLRDRDHLIPWAVILASVALRIMRLTYLSRTQPQRPASLDLSAPEIEAIVRLARPHDHTRGATPTIAQAVYWIARIGGYTGKSSGGPPGALVIARGLRRIEPLVDVLVAEGKRCDQW